MGFHGSAILPYIYSISYSSYASLALSQMMKCHRVVFGDRRMSAVFGVRLMGLGPRDLVRAWAA